MPTLNNEHTLRRYNLTEAEVRRAQLLCPEAIAYYEDLSTECTEAICSFVFSADPKDHPGQILEFVRLKAHRDCILNLLTDCQLAYTQAALSPESGG